MTFNIPSPVRTEHQELHRTLEAITNLLGKTGEAAKTVARLLHPHFVKEEEFALPNLGLLPLLATDKVSSDMRAAVTFSDILKKNLPEMLKEHQQIAGALQILNQAATEENHPEVVNFTEKLMLHARTEEDILYPAAILIGEYLKMKL
jgi:hypothetical protein